MEMETYHWVLKWRRVDFVLWRLRSGTGTFRQHHGPSSCVYWRRHGQTLDDEAILRMGKEVILVLEVLQLSTTKGEEEEEEEEEEKEVGRWST